jgi:hypothetical protein
MAKNLLYDGKTPYHYAAAIIVVLVLAAAFLLSGNRGGAPAANNAAVSLPSPAPSQAACANGEQKDFACVGTISGTQTYYECANGAWESRSRYNYSECVKTFGPNESIEDIEEAWAAQASATATPTVAANATAAPTASAAPTVFASPIPPASASAPLFVNLSVKAIRASSADLYWFSSTPATGTVQYGDEPGVRRWALEAQVPSASQFQQFNFISPNKTYYFEVEICAAGACTKTPTLSFSTPLVDKYFYDDTTIPYPGGEVNYTAAQLNPG